MKKYLFIILFILVNPLLSANASNNDNKEQAKILLDQAIQSYQNHHYQEALLQFDVADKQGHFKAARYLGLMYLNGNGVEKNEIKALHFFEKSADKGDLTSQYWLGYLYDNGIAVKQDWQKAEHYYRLSAVRGLTDECAQQEHCNPAVSAPAMFALAQLNEKQNKLDLAIDYYQRAIKMNDADIAKLATSALQRLGITP